MSMNEHMEVTNNTNWYMNNTIAYQMDLLNAKSSRLNKEKKVYRKVSELMGYGIFYENFRDNTELEVGDWDKILGFHQDSYENMKDFFRNLDNCENVSIERTEQIDENTLYREFSFRLLNKTVWISNTIWAEFEDGQIVEQISCFKNITRFKQQNEELEFLAFYDMVTGLYNRNYFVKELCDLLEKEHNERTWNTISVISMKIEGFKKINEGMGIVAGDEVLQEVGFRLQELKDDKMIIARFDAGEFYLAIADASGKRSVENIYAKICNRMREPISICQHEPLQLHFSFGVAEYPEAGDSALELIHNAQIVRKSANTNGRNVLKYYDQKVVKNFMEKLSLEEALKEALERGQFELYFQPQYDIQTKKLRGAETLLRWKREDGKFVPNNLYIPIAEANGEIIRIGKWVMRQAISSLAEWEKGLGFTGILSINASTVQLKQEDFVPNVLELVEEFKIRPEHLEIEITESVVMEDLELIVGKFRLLRQHGIRVSLDDFGTGFSSLTYLKDLPIDTLKIDKTFIDSVTTDSSTNIITQSVVDMVRQLGLETVAEGVETEEQYQFLEDIQCDNIQGFLLGRPMPEEQFIMVCKKDQ